jgi:plastocyanin
MKRFALGLALTAIALLTVACSSGGSTAAPATAAPASPGASAGTGDGVTIVAKDLAFTPTAVAIPADTATDIVLDNQEDVPHNIAIKDAAGAEVFKGEIVTKTQVTNAVPALAAGAYTFWCEVHPNMTGTLTAE